VSKLSAYVLTFNEEDKIRDALASIAWADEIVVLDSHSTDRTISICREFTEKVYQCDFEGFGKLRNRALEYLTHDWVLSLDADERATTELRDEIKAELSQGPRFDAYFVPRKNLFLGRWIRHGGWYPDYRQPQFFNKHRLRYRDDLVHEGYQVDGRIGYFHGHVMQMPFRDLGQFLQKMSRYSTLMADQMAQRGRQFHVHQLVTHPLFTFFKMYVARQGFRDRIPGLILALLYAYYSFIKYAKLWERTRLAHGRHAR
jgi:glycosyltransferase involved in cell wall biosynthesis